MLTNLLPGLRELRAPLVSGYLWLLFFFLLLHTDLPTRDSADAAIQPAFDLADRVSALGLATVASVAAYLIGSAMQELLRFGGRILSPARPLYGEPGVHTSADGRKTLWGSTEVKLQAITRRLFQVALSPGERGINEVPKEGEVIADLRYVRTLLLGEHPELADELDRLQAEADLRITVSIPFGALAIFMACHLSHGWLIGLVPAVLLLIQGYQRQKEAGDFLARVLQVGRTDPPVVSAYELSVEAALERTALEWQLRNEMTEGDGMAAFRYGNLLSSEGEYEKAIEPLEKAAEGGVLRAHAEIGFAHEQLGDAGRAEQAYRDGAERGDARSRQRLTQLLESQHRSDEALESAKTEEDEEPSSKVAVPTVAERIAAYERGIEENNAKAAVNLGLLFDSQKRPREAIQAFERATEIDAKDARAWTYLGLALARLQRPKNAVAPLERALYLYERELGPDHLEVAMALGNLGIALGQTGEYERSLELQQRTLAIQERELEPDHIDLAITYNNIGEALRRLGRFWEARDSEERALAIAEREQGPNGRQVAAVLSALGNSTLLTGDPARAKALQDRALSIREEDLGSEDPQVGDTLLNIGAALHAMGKLKEAMRFQRRALSIYENEPGAPTARLVYGLNAYAALLFDLERFREAMAAQERALAIAKGSIGKGSPLIAAMRSRLGATLGERRELHRALEMQERSVRQLEELLGPDHPDLAEAMNELGATLLALGRPVASEEVRRQAVEMVKGSPWLGQDEIIRGLAESLLSLGRLQEAKNLVEEVIAAEEGRGVQNPRTLADAFDLLAKILDAADQVEAAGSARRRAQALRRAARGD